MFFRAQIGSNWVLDRSSYLKQMGDGVKLQNGRFKLSHNSYNKAKQMEFAGKFRTRDYSHSSRTNACKPQDIAFREKTNFFVQNLLWLQSTSDG